MSTNLKAILGVLRHAAIAQRGVLTPSDTKELDALYESHAQLLAVLKVCRTDLKQLGLKEGGAVLADVDAAINRAESL
jgi:hypothetical protein